jgi:pyruvate,orthophosphate dikinase
MTAALATRICSAARARTWTEMASIGLPVPPGFTITTEMCTRYYADGEVFPDSLREEVEAGIAHIEGVTGKRFGDAADPLLVSVRSGARVSMPGMMDTVLNLGLNDETVEGLAATSGDARFAWDSYRRFIQMYSDVVLELDHGAFEEALEIAKEDKGYHLDTEMRRMTGRRWSRIQEAGREARTGASRSRRMCTSSSGARSARCSAAGSRPREGLSPVEQHPRRMGHGRQRAGDGVRQHGRYVGHRRGVHARSRDRRERLLWRILINAQGEDVVAGIRTPQYLTKAARERAGAKPLSMEEAMPEVYAELARVFNILETHYRDMQDIEFTVERASSGCCRPARQAHRQGRAEDRGRYGERGADHARRKRCPRRSPRLISCCTRRSIPRRRATC